VLVSVGVEDAVRKADIGQPRRARCGSAEQFAISGSWVICRRVGSVTQVQKHGSDQREGVDRSMSMSMEKRRATGVVW
jgi:hypothetical protein